ncbi:YbaB/EbfC family DNA-binding protein [Nocardia camponoti]|uniref:YbaB/EbfC family DNA-binding protein n=1 Tax=Nocardia camponoti TaxID=1616106 RepID=A0A917QAY7_9NOCA|nr:YbaB/EbfC family DNA-binding protein [Nocardia camponoti]GGK40239.1 hypothetical protein GCM10011591_09870 [Nocardia camponoti]
MDDWPTRASNDGLRQQVDAMVAAYADQRSVLAAAKAAADEPVQCWSANNLVRVTGNASGVSEVHLVPEAFKRSTPETLARSITEALGELSARVALSRERALGALGDLSDEMPELAELIPGAPPLREIAEQVLPADRAPYVDEDEYYRNGGYLR